MAAASPIPALADRVSAIRDAALTRCAEVSGVDTPAARSEMLNLREALRLLGLAEDRLRMCGAGETVAEPMVPRRSGFSEAADHPLGSSAMGTARNP